MFFGYAFEILDQLVALFFPIFAPGPENVLNDEHFVRRKFGELLPNAGHRIDKCLCRRMLEIHIGAEWVGVVFRHDEAERIYVEALQIRVVGREFLKVILGLRYFRVRELRVNRRLQSIAMLLLNLHEVIDRTANADYLPSEPHIDAALKINLPGLVR